jgi:hypothetical protein
VLLKAPFTNGGTLRAGQLVPARVVWNSKPGIEVETSAVFRQTGQHFVYVAEAEADGGAGAVARLHQVTVGGIESSRYAVLAGLKVGDRLVTSQIQNLHDGDALEIEDAPSTASSQPDHQKKP